MLKKPPGFKSTEAHSSLIFTAPLLLYVGLRWRVAVGKGQGLVEFLDLTGFNSLLFFFQEVAQLELLCKQLYESQDANQMSEAEKALVNFQNSSDR